MEITVVQGNITELKTDAAVVNLFEGVKQPGGGTGAVDMALDRAISNLIADGELTGKEGGDSPTAHDGQNSSKAGSGGRPRQKREVR